MLADPLVPVAHIASDVGAPAPFVAIGLVLVLAFAALLTLEHVHVKHGRLSLRDLTKPLAVFAILAVVVGAAPTPGFAQTSSEPTGLPDLISDPPTIWFTRTTRTPQGELIRVMTFDGYIHNIGTGALRVAGNPQLDDGMQQQVFDGNKWTDIGAPTVKFETDDGHNHFHLMRAVDYALWDHARSAPVTDASKVGFCLVDTEQREEGYDAVYMIDDFNYCGVDEPEATDITMGITPGWRDTYDANVTLQWIDISDVQPGIYWTSAETDVNNEIVESNEDNNGIVFSRNQFAVDGYIARELEPQQSNAPIELQALPYGNPGSLAFVIETGPTNGSLDVPLGADLLTETITYTPDAGFDGADSFTYYAHDVTSPFPFNPTMVTVSVSAAASEAGTDEAAESVSGASTSDLAIVDPGAQTWSMHERVDLQLAATGSQSSDLRGRWYATNLPPGLLVDLDSGAVRGTPTFDGSFTSTIAVVLAELTIERTIEWQIEPASLPSLLPPNDLSSLSQQLLRLPFGLGTAGAEYQATGLPEGALVVSNQPMLTGVPREIGDFQVEVHEMVDGEVVDSVSFTWTIRASTRPVFPI